MSIRAPVGARVVLGVVVAGMACLVWWMGSTVGMRIESGGKLPDIAWQSISVAIAVLAFWIGAYRSGTTIDQATGELVTWSGLLGPMKRRVRRLEEFAEVSVTKEVRSSGKNTVVVFPVRLVAGEEASRNFTVTAGRDALAARQTGESVAKAAWKPLRVDIAGASEVRPPEHLDWSLARRLREAGTVPPRPEPPRHTKVHVDWEGDQARIEVDAPGMMKSGMLLGAMAVPGLVMAGGLFFVFAAAEPWFLAMFILFLGIPIGVLLIIVGKQGLCSLRVSVSPGQLGIEERRPPAAVTTTRFDGAKVESVFCTDPDRPKSPLAGLVPTTKLTVVTDDAIRELGLGHSEEDVAYLAAVITHALCGGDEGDDWSRS